MAVQFDLENERAIIVSVLKDPDSRRMAVGAVQPEDFLGGRFRTIFKAAKTCQREGLVPDSKAIAVHCDGEDFGGYEFVDRLLDLEPSSNLEYHLSRLKRDAARIKVKKVELPELERMLSDRTVSHGECLGRLAEIQNELRVGPSREENLAEKWSKNLDMRCSGEIHFQSVGYSVLDDVLIDGYSKGQVSLIAGRTGNGKTTFIVDTIRRLLNQKRAPRICVLPLEIGQTRFLDKLISSVSLVPTLKLRKDAQELTLAEREEIKQVARKLVGTRDRLVVLENPFFSLPKWNNQTAMEKLEEILAEGGYDLLLMDLFQRCLTDIRPGEIETALVKVQHMAKLYDTHLCFVHQISRKAEERKDKRPELGDLKGSGGYEEIPDLIFLLHRAKTYKQFRKKDEIEVRLAKQRDDKTNVTVIGDFYPMVSRIENSRLAAEKNDGEEEEPEASEASVY